MNTEQVKIFAKKIIEKDHTIKTYFEIKPHYVQDQLTIVVSYDNKQLNKLYNIISNDSNSNATLIKISNSNAMIPKYTKIFKDCLKNNKKVIIFCISNSFQISKIIYNIGARIILDKNNHLKKIAIIHDEDNIITKDYNFDIEKLNAKQKEARTEWIEMLEYLSKVIYQKNL